MKTTRLFSTLLFAAIAVTFTLASCSKDDGGEPTPSPTQYTITVTTGGNGTAQAAVGATVATKAEAGATVTLTATPNEGFEFTGWMVISGEATLSPDAATNPATFTMPAEKVSVKAEFAAIPVAKYMITVADDGNGTTRATVGDIDADGVEAGVTVTLTATPNEGFEFTGWMVTSGEVALLPDAATNPATFAMPDNAVELKAVFALPSITINGVVWAACNVNAFGTFTAAPEEIGCLFQWGRPTAWLVTGGDPVSSPAGATWDSSTPDGSIWEAANDPCPVGWRVPSSSEQAALLKGGKVTNEWTTLNGVNGQKFTDNTSGASIFLPAASARDYDGTLYETVDLGRYWSGSPDSYYFPEYADLILFPTPFPCIARSIRAGAYSVRCVRH